MQLFYRKFGQGQPVIILHGLYGSSDNWVTVGKKLADNFEVFLIDQRNHGKSPHSAYHNYELMKNDLLEFMDEHFIKKAVIIGHSMGGKTAMFFSLDFPERLNSLIVIDISPKSYLNLTDYSPLAIKHLNIINAMLSIDFSLVKKRNDADSVLAKTINSVIQRQFLLKNIHRDKNNNFSWKLNIEAIRNNLPDILDGLNKNISEENKTTDFPVLFIKGENSDYIQKKDYTLIRNIFPYADIKVIKNASHWVLAEKPIELINIISEFIHR
ncbi:MAG: alpha/beta fold hydrolase [Bacteroidales bacterium]|nr:alpha/beta fold hydrolase [Bacteroidales bacterium]